MEKGTLARKGKVPAATVQLSIEVWYPQLRTGNQPNSGLLICKNRNLEKLEFEPLPSTRKTFTGGAPTTLRYLFNNAKNFISKKLKAVASSKTS
jgi:hypothetical protein